MADDIRKTIVIDANTAGATVAINRLETRVKGFANFTSTAFKGLSTLGVGLGVGALVGFAKHVIDVGDQLSDLSDQTGFTIETLGGIKPILDSRTPASKLSPKGGARSRANSATSRAAVKKPLKL